MVSFLEPNVDFYTSNLALGREVREHFGNRRGKGRFGIRLNDGRKVYAVRDLVQEELLALLTEIEEYHDPGATYNVRITNDLGLSSKLFVRLRANISGQVRTITDLGEIEKILSVLNEKLMESQ